MRGASAVKLFCDRRDEGWMLVHSLPGSAKQSDYLTAGEVGNPGVVMNAGFADEQCVFRAISVWSFVSSWHTKSQPYISSGRLTFMLHDESA